MKINARLGHRPSFTLSLLASSPGSTSTSGGGGGGGGAGSVGAPDYAGEEKIYVREHFVPPEISMVNYFLEKVKAS